MDQRFDWDEPRKKQRSFGFESGLLRAALATRNWRLVAPSLAAVAMVGLFLTITTPRYAAEAKVSISNGAGGFIGLKTRQAALDGLEMGPNEARLLGSRDLARRAIKELGLEGNHEFDLASQASGPFTRTMVLAGILRDPRRMTEEERLLDSFQSHLSVVPVSARRELSIAFQSENPELAARAANKVADLYLEMQADARILSRAVAPQEPAFPRRGPFLLSAALAAFLLTLATLASSELYFRRRASGREGPIVQPKPLGEVPLFARLPETPWAEPAKRRILALNSPDRGQAHTPTEIAARIKEAPKEDCAKRIVVTSLTSASRAPASMIGLARELARDGRTILVDLDPAHPVNIEEFALRGNKETSQREHRCGIADLLAGNASFAEVIRRDPASRLHFLPAEEKTAIDLRDFDSSLNALSQTYDFILLNAPALDRSDTAKTFAGRADCVILAALSPGDRAICEAHADLVAKGAREVLVIGRSARHAPRLVQNVA